MISGARIRWTFMQVVFNIPLVVVGEIPQSGDVISHSGHLPDIISRFQFQRESLKT